MNKIKLKIIFILTHFSLLSSFILIWGCQPDEPVKPINKLSITGISIPATIDVSTGGEITIAGKGFEEGDQIMLSSATTVTTIYIADFISVNEESAIFFMPEEAASDSYKLTILRDDESQILGTVFINIILDIDIPDINGMTIKGVVYSNGKGIPGVVVSDGAEVTKTDNNGIYYLASTKEQGFVFISVPGNHKARNTNNQPDFYKRITSGTPTERIDFSLIETDNSNHVVLTMADWHLANRNDDVNQFTNGFLNDLNNIIDHYESEGKNVYGLTLGDMSWDTYWYSNNFALPEYLIQMYKINCTIFNMMGNHDNDPYYPGDRIAEQTYRDLVGPVYYSFNLGEIHYVVLDNIEYVNTGGSQGVVGDRNYKEIIIQSQLEWLKKDLAALEDNNTPIIIGMHHQLYKNPILDVNGTPGKEYALDNAGALLSVLDDYTNVRILTGHTHINYSVKANDFITEHNTAAVCATWWWTGKPNYAGNHICKDGSPGGYGIWEANGTELEWKYKSIGYPTNYQFRSYDLNTVHITAAQYAPNSSEELLAPYSGEYASTSSANEVLINIWGYEPGWDISVTENGTALEVTRLNAKDPLHIISYEAKRLDNGSTPTSGFVTNNTAHMFKVKAGSPGSTLEIKVTDTFGNIYTESMERPKEFTYTMR